MLGGLGPCFAGFSETSISPSAELIVAVSQSGPERILRIRFYLVIENIGLPMFAIQRNDVQSRREFRR